MRIPDRVAAWLLVLAAILFFFRGPDRALRLSVSLDHAVNYSSGRLWLKGVNPYDHALLAPEFLAAGGPERLTPKRSTQPAVYLPPALPVFAVLAALPWGAANAAWCLLSTGAFLLSVILLVRRAGVRVEDMRVWAAVALVFSPVHTGLAMGNPSVLACASTTLAVLTALEGAVAAPPLLLGLAHCLKPQISICGVLLLALWRAWPALLLSGLPPLATGVIAAARAPSVAAGLAWLTTLRDNLASGFAAGGANASGLRDPGAYLLVNAKTLAALVTDDRAGAAVLVWFAAVGMTALFLLRRGADGPETRDRDLGFAAVVTLMVAYHRYYDAQLLLLALPFVARAWRERPAFAAAASSALALLAFPTQALGGMFLASDPGSLSRFLLFRHQPCAVIALGALLIPSAARGAQAGDGRDERAG